MTHEEEDPSATVYKSSIYCAFANGGDCDRTFQLSNLDYQIGLFKSSPSRILKKLDLYNPNDHLFGNPNSKLLLWIITVFEITEKVPFELKLIFQVSVLS